MDTQDPPNRPRLVGAYSPLGSGSDLGDPKKDAMMSRALARKQVQEATPSECTPGPAGQYACIPNDFFCRLAGRSAPTGKAIVHWIGY